MALIPQTVNLGIFRGRGIGRGRLTKDVSPSVDIFLTPDECMAQIITYTGALTASITVHLPLGAHDNGFRIEIDNQSTGAFNITTAGVAGAGVIVPQGRKQVVEWNSATVFIGDDGALRHSMATINVTTAADRTLSNPEYACFIQRLTGTPGGGWNLIVPTSFGAYLVNNETNGICTVKTAAGTGVAVAAGSAALLWCNGTNVQGLFIGTLIVS